MASDTNDDDVVDLVTLNMSIGVGAVVYRKLRSRFGSAREILKASEASLRSADGISAKVARAIVEARGKGDEEMDRANQHSVRIIPHNHDDYPKNLLSIYAPPLVLYVKGNIIRQDLLAISIVGARRATHYGMTQSTRFASSLGRMGFTIVSGLAEGVDTTAHRGALRVKARTIAVLGNGLCDIYPKRNRKLAEEIAESGAVVSEFPMETRVDARHFPQRNRVISGLSLGVLVIEASKKSGALITSKWALEQGREVYALPGPVDSPMSQGTNHLIKQGAKLVTNSDDVVDELGPLAELIERPDDEPLEDVRELTLNQRERQIFNSLSHQPKHIDQIIRDTGLPVSVVASTLTILEIKRFVQQLAGKNFVKV